MPNSIGSSALISWTGTPSPADDNFHLVATKCPSGNTILFYYGGVQNSAPFGDGVSCVSAGGVGLYRFKALQVDIAGWASMKVDFDAAPAGSGAPGAWSPGDTWFCQAWYRDPEAGGAGFNLTNGLEVQVCAGGQSVCGNRTYPRRKLRNGPIWGARVCGRATCSHGDPRRFLHGHL